MENDLENKCLEQLELSKESLFRVCKMYAKDKDSARDYLQESILNIWKSLPSFQQKSSLKTWMYRITINVCLRLSKEKRRAKLFVSIELKGEIAQDWDAEPDVRLAFLRKCISSLDESNKALVLLYLEELSYKEISNILGLTENHIAVKMKRLRKKLFHCINQQL